MLTVTVDVNGEFIGRITATNHGPPEAPRWDDERVYEVTLTGWPTARSDHRTTVHHRRSKGWAALVDNIITTVGTWYITEEGDGDG